LEARLTTPLEIQLYLMTIAYFYGDFAIIYHFTNRNSALYTAVMGGDLNALHKFLNRNDFDFNALSAEDQEKFNRCHQLLTGTYRTQLEKNPVPLPDDYLIDLAERALEFGHFSTANSALEVIDKLDKKVNEFIVKGTELLQSRDVKEDMPADDVQVNEVFHKTVREAAVQFYQAVRLKNPLGNQFQYLGPHFHLKDHESFRKYMKYVELNLLKEIIEFAISYLTDDQAIAVRIINQLHSGKTRKLFLKYFAEQFSVTGSDYEDFISRFKQAADSLKSAKEDKDFMQLQKILLGRNTGNNEYYQFIRELAVEHPISPILVAISLAPDGTPFLAPIILKSGISLVEFLELDK